MAQTVLIIELDKIMQHSLVRMFSGSYKVIVGNDISVTEHITCPPDLVILDQVKACTTIRQQWPGIAIIVLSTQSHERRIVHALDLGADDYIIKPFSDQELQARVRAHLRRAAQPRNQQEEPEQLSSEDNHISLNSKKRQTYVGGQLIRLTPTEFSLLWYLLLHAGKVVSHRRLLQEVWGPEYGDEEDYLRVYVRQIRRKIEEIPSQPRYLLTASGIGYVFRYSSPSFPYST